NGCVVGVALRSATPAAIVVAAVAILLAVRVVVLVLVRNEVAQGEPVVRGDEVDAGARAAPGRLVEIGAAGESLRELAERLIAPAPVVAHGVAVAPVPFAPQRWEVVDLVAAVTEVPRLGDQLHLADDRVLLDDVEERRQAVDVVQRAGEGGREI